MTIIDIKDGTQYYNTGGIPYCIVKKFGQQLKAGRIKYRTGNKKNGVFYTEILTLNIKDKDFEDTFEKIAKSELGKFVMSGEAPIMTIL